MAKSRKRENSRLMFLLVILPLAALGLSSFAIYKGVQNYITTSDYFRIRELKVEGIQDLQYLGLIKREVFGGNIFRLDAGRLAQKIKSRFPTFYSVTVTRVLPCRLQLVAKERLPVAVMKRDAYYLFDAEGVVISSFPKDAILSFPLITGLESRLSQLKVGVSYESRILAKPLLLAKALKESAVRIEDSFPADNKLKVTRIDASDADQLTFYLGDDIPVKVGDRDFEGRVALLPMVIATVGPEWPRVQYIDLRPKEPAVAMKDSKDKRKTTSH